MDSSDTDVNLIEIFRPRLLTLIKVQPVLDRLHSIPNKDRELVRSRARRAGDQEAVGELLDLVLREPRDPGWFRVFVDALSEAGCEHAAEYMSDKPPPADVEADNDNCVRLIQLMSPSLLSMKTAEVCVHCRADGLLDDEDEEKVNAETTTSGNTVGARELLRRIVRRPPGWFPIFLSVLKKTEHYYLYKELTNDNTGEVPSVSSDFPIKQEVPAVEASPVVEEEGCLDTTGESCADCYNDENSDNSVLQDDSDRSINLSLSDGVSNEGGMVAEEGGVAAAEGGVAAAEGGVAEEEEISLRDYQAEVAAPALEGSNIIVCLPTGSGKTRVAVYITKAHLDARRREGRPGKVVVLVNKIPLVEQHYSGEFSRFLKRHYKVDRVSGNSVLKISFTEMIRNNEVIICTAQILENNLGESPDEDDDRVELSDVTLMVIDECHHTQKGEVYNNIMMRYLKQKHINAQSQKQGKEPMSIPQILGLTASPGVGGATKSAKAVEHILRICANLDACKIMTSSGENTKELYKRVATVEERREDPFGDVIKNIMSAIHTHADLHMTCDFGTQNYEQWVVQREKNAAKEEDQKVRVCTEHLRHYSEGLELSKVIRMCDALDVLSAYQEAERKKKEVPKEEEAEPIQTTATESFLFNLFDDKKQELQRFAKMPEYENNSLSRLRVQILKEFTTRENARGIIFTKTRRSAIALTQWVQGNPKFEDVNVCPQYVIGGGDQSVVKPMTAAEQRDALNKFQHGKVNLLIATTVAEEGLDIPACNFVIRYGLVTNEISMIQAQGRARAKDSSYTLVEVLGSGVVEKENVNEFRQKMMNKAIIKIKNMDQEEFNKKINTYQVEAVQEWRLMMMKKRNQLMKNDSPSAVSFSCRSCNKFLCTGEDIEVIDNMHHVVVSTAFRELFNKKENTSLQERNVDYETNLFIACKVCGQNLLVTYKGKKSSCARHLHRL
ncbi:hypothetical protein CRUP_008410 [Coryphaenoides rupestris]|nr:hypothetical protein CRUP_008410 [Coryphaenoides rupestris]